MKLYDIASILFQIQIKAGEMQNVNPDMLDSMAQGGLIEIMPEGEYQKHVRNASLISLHKKELDNLKHLADSIKLAEIRYLRKFSSIWRQTFSRQSALDKEEKEHNSHIERISTLGDEIEEKICLLADCENSENAISGFVSLGSGAARLTEKARILLPRMMSRMYRLKNCKYGTFEKEIAELDKAIHETLTRFLNFFLLLRNVYEGNDYIVESALQLTRFPGGVENLFDRCENISRLLLRNENWNRYQQMPIAAGLVGMFEYSPEEAVRKILEVQKALRLVEYPDNYHTTNASLVIVKNKADINISHTLQNIEATYDKMESLMGWSRTSENAPIAARLTFKGNGAVERVHKIFNKLTESEWDYSQKTAILAVILACGLQQSEELAIRTQHIFDSLEESGWSRSEDFNIPAGILALLPGEPDVLVESLVIINKWLEKNKIVMNGIYLAANLLASAYIVLAEGDFFNKISQTINENSPDDKTAKDFLTFSLGWVVVADLLNNTRLYLYYDS